MDMHLSVIFLLHVVHIISGSEVFSFNHISDIPLKLDTAVQLREWKPIRATL